MKIRLPSLQNIVSITKETAKRFPLGILSAGAITAVLLVLLEQKYEKNDWLLKLLLVLGISLIGTVNWKLFCERRELSNVKEWSGQGLLASAAVLYYIFLPEKLRGVDMIVYLSIGCILFFSYLSVSFKRGDDEDEFSKFTLLSFIRFLISWTYSWVLFLGIILALYVVEVLFDYKMGDKLFMRIYIVIFSMFFSLHFMAGIPTFFRTLKDEYQYPKPLKILLQNIGIPLVMVYLGIIYAYIAKAILFGEFTRVREISTLVISFSFMGIALILLLAPLKRVEENKWIRMFSEKFYLSVFPLVIFQFYAIFIRIKEYGVTEKRYYIVLFGFWLTGICLYYTLAKTKKMIVIPVSLAVIISVAIIGPWSVYNISKYSQLTILKTTLEKTGILTNGKIIKTNKEVELKDRKKISSILQYFSDVHGIAELKSVISNVKSNDTPYSISDNIGIKYIGKWDDGKTTKQYFSYGINQSDKLTAITGYDFHMKYDYSIGGTKKSRVTGGAVVVTVEGPILTVLKEENVIIEKNITDIAENIYKANKEINQNSHAVPYDSMVYEEKNGRYTLKVVFQNLYGNTESGKIEITSINAEIYFSVR